MVPRAARKGYRTLVANIERTPFQTFALTCVPSAASVWDPLPCTFFNRPLRKLCREAADDCAELALAAAPAAAVVAPLVPLTRLLNAVVRLAVAEVAVPPDPSCWINDCSDAVKLPY